MLAQNGDQFVPDDLDNLLRGAEGGKHLLAHGLDAHTLNEGLDYFEMDVGLKKSDTDLL